MDKASIEVELKAAGADRVMLQEDYGWLAGIGVEKGEDRAAMAWNPEHGDGSEGAVAELKRWLAERVPEHGRTS